MVLHSQVHIQDNLHTAIHHNPALGNQSTLLNLHIRHKLLINLNLPTGPKLLMVRQQVLVQLLNHQERKDSLAMFKARLVAKVEPYLESEQVYWLEVS
jgi:hypothetical protein